MDAEWQLIGERGRKYLTEAERRAFSAAAMEGPLPDRVLAHLLVHSGARLSEALSVRKGDLDASVGSVLVRTLKKRKDHFRLIPTPICVWQAGRRMVGEDAPDEQRLWTFCRTTGWRKMKRIFARAGIEGVHACPKGLRHGFAVSALNAGVPLPLLRRWLGHSSIRTTSIYTEVMGEEERAFAERMWW